MSEQSLSALVFDDSSIAGTIRALLQAVKFGAPDLYAEQAAHWLATHLLVKHGGADPHHLRNPSHRLSNARLARAIALIRARYSTPITLGMLASEAAISKFHFSRLFRERTGMSPHAFLVDTRLAVARRLLITSDVSIGEIARITGYRRLAQFGAAFKSSHGMTPKAFRDSSGSSKLIKPT